MEDHTTEFYQLISRNEVHETEDQLVAWYIGGLRVQIQEIVNLFDPVSVSSTPESSTNRETIRATIWWGFVDWPRK